jgi:hypothetical protein
MHSAQVGQMHTDLVAEVTESIRTVKLGSYFSAIPNMMLKLDQAARTD